MDAILDLLRSAQGGGQAAVPPVLPARPVDAVDPAGNSQDRLAAAIAAALMPQGSSGCADMAQAASAALGAPMLPLMNGGGGNLAEQLLLLAQLQEQQQQQQQHHQLGANDLMQAALLAQAGGGAGGFGMGGDDGCA